MPRDERHRQKALARKAEKRKKKTAGRGPTATMPSLRDAAHWPLYECQVSRSWQEPGELVQILVARNAGGEVAAAGFLVDLGCLGVKDALSQVFTSHEYEQFRSTFTALQPMVRADVNLAAKVIQEGVAYAKGLGFNPHPDYYRAAPLLKEADPAACDMNIPLGIEGQPFFMPGPHDNPRKVLAQLERAVGPGNYHDALGADDELSSIDLPALDEGREESSTPRFLDFFRRRRSES